MGAVWGIIFGVLTKLLPALATALTAYVARKQEKRQQDEGRTSAAVEGLLHGENEAAKRLKRETEVARLGGSDLDGRLGKWVRDKRGPDASGG